MYVSGNTFGSLGGPSAGDDDPWLARHDSSGQQLWIRQLGTLEQDSASHVAPDGTGGAYVCGHTFGSLGGPSAGWSDVWLGRFDHAGNPIWIDQFGTTEDDWAPPVTPNACAGVYVNGYTGGSLGSPNAGYHDPWLGRFDVAGNRIWLRQFGTGDDDAAITAAPDASAGVYVCGTTAIFGTSATSPVDAWIARVTDD